jgi:hypothetical protein
MIYQLLVIYGLPETPVPVYRYFCPMLGTGDEAFDSTVTRMKRLIAKSSVQNNKSVSAVIPFIGECTTFVDRFSNNTNFAIEESMRFLCGAKTVKDHLHNPFIKNKIYRND